MKYFPLLVFAFALVAGTAAIAQSMDSTTRANTGATIENRVDWNNRLYTMTPAERRAFMDRQFRRLPADRQTEARQEWERRLREYDALSASDRRRFLREQGISGSRPDSRTETRLDGRGEFQEDTNRSNPSLQGANPPAMTPRDSTGIPGGNNTSGS
ncbi:MAG: hypothetical protein AB7U41_01340, partial [Dongiaceae bacterium]